MIATHNTPQALRAELQVQVDGEITFGMVLIAAIARARAAASNSRSRDLYDTWHQHNGTKTNVLQRFGQILTETGAPAAETMVFVLEFDQRYGTGQALYFA